MRTAFLLSLLVVTGCVRLPSAPSLTGDDGARLGLVPSGGAQAPLELSLSRHPGGEAWRLADDRGSVVLLDVWATWCDPCRESLPFYEDVARQFGARGLKVYAISVDADAAVIAPFLKDLKLTLPVLHDPEAAVSGSTLKVKQMPTSVLVDRRGVVRRVHEGLSDDYFQQTLTDVERLLAEPAK
ncbi:MAG: TlpA family protein disulfide reductase [Myxococcus sp.]|nr:TlpA family protein disulfide reductase [Myxococcus sp.]